MKHYILSQTNRKNLYHSFLFGMMIIILVHLAGCGNGTDIIWSSKEVSADGVWIATAKTSQNTGPGTASVSTEVDLTSAHSAYPPFIILGFVNTTAYPIGVTAVKMKWITNSHLDVTYPSDAVLEFQAIKAGGVTITARQSIAAKL